MTNEERITEWRKAYEQYVALLRNTAPTGPQGRAAVEYANMRDWLIQCYPELLKEVELLTSELAQAREQLVEARFQYEKLNYDCVETHPEWLPGELDGLRARIRDDVHKKEQS